MKVRYFIVWGCVPFSQVSFQIMSPGGSLGGVFGLPGELSWGMSRAGLGGSRPFAQYLVDLPPDFVKVSGGRRIMAMSPGNTLGKAIERIAVNFFRVGEKWLAEKMRA